MGRAWERMSRAIDGSTIVSGMGRPGRSGRPADLTGGQRAAPLDKCGEAHRRYGAQGHWPRTGLLTSTADRRRSSCSSQPGQCAGDGGENMTSRRHSVQRLLSGLVAGLLSGGLLVGFGSAEAQVKPEGEMRWALYVTVAPAWLDPGEVLGFITPFWIQYALHDALVKPMPGNIMTPSLAESWTLSPDQRVYEFKLRQGLKFHNGDAFTAEDVKFSFFRAKSSKVLKDKVREVEIVDPYRVRFHLHEPFPDFMAFYGTLATASSWIVPKSYVEKVGDDGFKKQPVGLGPYKFVSNAPGVELILEANESYWRKVPSVKRLVLKSVPEATTRAAMLKKGEVDIAYLLDAPAALELRRDPAFTVAFSGAIGIHFLDFFD